MEMLSWIPTTVYLSKLGAFDVEFDKYPTKN